MVPLSDAVVCRHLTLVLISPLVIGWGQGADRRDVWNMHLAHDGVHDVAAICAGATSTRLHLRSNDRTVLTGTLDDVSSRASKVFWKSQDTSVQGWPAL
jgi:hypothetical protein